MLALTNDGVSSELVAFHVKRLQRQSVDDIATEHQAYLCRDKHGRDCYIDAIAADRIMALRKEAITAKWTKLGSNDNRGELEVDNDTEEYKI